MKRTFKIAVALALLATLAFTVFTADAAKERQGIYDNTLRIHILANSDTDADQKLKLKVRDRVLALLSDRLNECRTKAESEALITEMREQIEEEAEKAISEEGKNYGASLTVTEEEYPKRTYGSVTLPAGKYTSVRILLGEAEGQNWWCVLFPQVCTDTAMPADERLAQVGFTPNQIRILTEEERPVYRMRFKIAELIGSIFK